MLIIFIYNKQEYLNMLLINDVRYVVSS